MILFYSCRRGLQAQKTAGQGSELEGFGFRLQYAVFESPLVLMWLAKLEAELRPVLNADEEQIPFVSLGARVGDATLVVGAMGLPYEVRSRLRPIAAWRVRARQ